MMRSCLAVLTALALPLAAQADVPVPGQPPIPQAGEPTLDLKAWTEGNELFMKVYNAKIQPDDVVVFQVNYDQSRIRLPGLPPILYPAQIVLWDKYQNQGRAFRVVSAANTVFFLQAGAFDAAGQNLWVSDTARIDNTTPGGDRGGPQLYMQGIDELAGNMEFLIGRNEAGEAELRATYANEWAGYAWGGPNFAMFFDYDQKIRAYLTLDGPAVAPPPLAEVEELEARVTLPTSTFVGMEVYLWVDRGLVAEPEYLRIR